jgi:hypothetical protein
VVANFGAPRQFKHVPPDGYVSVHDAAKSRQSQGDNARLNQPDYVVTVLDESHDSVRRITTDNADGVTTDTRNAMGAALCATSKCGDLRMLRMLLNAGADVNYKDADGKTAVDHVISTDVKKDVSTSCITRGDLVRSTADPERTGTVAQVDNECSCCPCYDDVSCCCCLSCEKCWPYVVRWDDTGNEGRNRNISNQLQKIMQLQTLNELRASIRKTLLFAGCLPSDALNNAAAALCAASKSGDLLLVRALFKAGADVNYTDTDGKTQNAIALAANSDTLRIFSPLWAPTKEGTLEVKTLAGEIKELEFTWAGFGSRSFSITDVAAVLCDPEHAEQDLSNAEQLAGNVAAVKGGSMKKEIVTVAGVEGRRANALNGLYEDTGDLYNGKPLFRKRNDPGGAFEWLRNDKDNQWLFSDTQSKDANNTGCCCASVEAGKDHPTHVNKWSIYANGAIELWEEHAPMKCIGSHITNFVENVAAVLCDPEHAEQNLSNAEQLAGNVAAVKRAAMKKENVTVAGVEGRRANELNGLYEVTGELYNGKPLFRKRNEPGGACEWLRNDKDNQWSFTSTASKDANNTTCLCYGLRRARTTQRTSTSGKFTRMEPTNRGESMLR